jgi:hypothetical protein
VLYGVLVMYLDVDSYVEKGRKRCGHGRDQIARTAVAMAIASLGYSMGEYGN